MNWHYSIAFNGISLLSNQYYCNIIKSMLLHRHSINVIVSILNYLIYRNLAVCSSLGSYFLIEYKIRHESELIKIFTNLHVFCKFPNVLSDLNVSRQTSCKDCGSTFLVLVVRVSKCEGPTNQRAQMGRDLPNGKLWLADYQRCGTNQIIRANWCVLWQEPN